MNRILSLLIFSSIVGYLNPVPAKATETQFRQKSLDYQRFLQVTPKSVIKLNGPFESRSNEKYPHSFNIEAVPNCTNFLHRFSNLISQAAATEYVTVTDRVQPNRGFQLVKLEESVIKNLQKFCRENANSTTSYGGKEVYVFEEKTMETIWDSSPKTESEKHFYCFLDSNTVLATNRINYFKQNSNSSKMVPVKVGPGGQFSVFKTESLLTPKSICVERIFDSKDLFFRKEVPERIEAVHFDRTGNFLQRPFKLLVYTRKDSLSDAQVLFRQFTDLNDEKKSIKRLQACKYELTIDSDPEFFYICLLGLLMCGNPDSVEKG